MIGETLSHYKIVEKLGEGGMGVVWKALDTQLDREVAVKILPETFSSDLERVARFEREAKLLASLNHRNIAAIYGLDEADGQRFLVMELVEGQDLARKLESGPLPVDESIDLCHQLARALEAAHEKGVLHRDLKPANVQVTPEGRVKVLDFGLAKAFEVEVEGDGGPASSPTLTSAGTRAGMILGTAGYMSPEQARGKTLDKRTDIWSFGCILYECLTGRPAFRGETISDTLASILKSEANYTLLPERTPPRVYELLQRCFEKEARNRLRDIGDARLELQRSITGRESLSGVSGVSAGPPGAWADAPVEGRRASWAFVAAALLAGIVIGAGVWSFLGDRGGAGPSGLTDVARFSIRIPDDQLAQAWAASPDGRALVYVASPRHTDDPDAATKSAYLRRFDATEPVRIDGSAEITNFTFSPDGRWIAARVPVSPKSTRDRLVKLRVDGSAPPLTLMELPDTWGGPFLWLPDGDIVMGQFEPLAVIRVPADGSRPSEPIEIVKDGFEGVIGPGFSQACMLPDGKHALGDIVSYTESSWDVHVGLLDLQTGRARIVVDNGGNGKWSATGHVLFTRGETLMAVPFDPERLEPTGAQVAVTDGLFTTTVYNAEFDLFPDGTLVHPPGGLVGVDRRLMFVDGSTLAITEPWSDDRRPFEGGLSVSDDGKRLAVSLINAERYYEIWGSETDRPRLTRLVRERGEDCTPGPWHPDGERVVYTCRTTERSAIYLRSAEGADAPRRLIEWKTVMNEAYGANSFTPDGTELILSHWVEGEPELMRLPLDETDATPLPLLDGAAGGGVSPDGRFILYASDASGRNEIYLRGIEAGLRLGREVPVTSDGSGWAWWHSRAGEPLKIWYVSSTRLHEIDVTPGARVRLSEPRLIGDMSELLAKLRGGLWDLHDGRFLATVQGKGEDTPRELTVVVNWRRELERRLHVEH